MWQKLWGWVQRLKPLSPLAGITAPRAIPDHLWHELLVTFPFLRQANSEDEHRLRVMCGRFLQSKEFQGAGGLMITDSMALAIAAQACLPVLHLGLDWYGDFLGIVVHPGDVVARREVTDEHGVVHVYDEVLAGEAMDRGPVMLNWPDVAAAGSTSGAGYNLVIHEFAHKIDLQDGRADGCPPLPAGFAGLDTAALARGYWLSELQAEYDQFRECVIVAERFGGMPPWLDAYGASSLDEFFAVTCEAYFVNRSRFTSEHPRLLTLFDAFFRPKDDQLTLN